MLYPLADHDDDLRFVLYVFGGVFRDDHVFFMGDQRVVGAITDIGLLRDVEFPSMQRRLLLDVVDIVQAGRIKSFRLERDQQFHRIERNALTGFLMAAEKVALDHFDFRSVNDAV